MRKNIFLKTTFMRMVSLPTCGQYEIYGLYINVPSSMTFVCDLQPTYYSLNKNQVLQRYYCQQVIVREMY